MLDGVRLDEMDAEDMLDVVHYVFEEDLMPSFTEKPQDVRSSIRAMMYESLYGRPYANDTRKGGDGDDFTPSDEIKPYFPPTNPEDFDKVLGAPVGG